MELRRVARNLWVQAERGGGLEGDGIGRRVGLRAARELDAIRVFVSSSPRNEVCRRQGSGFRLSRRTRRSRAVARVAGGHGGGTQRERSPPARPFLPTP